MHSKRRIEASIAEGYITEECLDFCSRYLNSTIASYNDEQRNYQEERKMGSASGEPYKMTDIEQV